ncbi:AAA family ATPase [Ottowia sp.]|uniref:AAA family ATPase n=1 Tax=Ottowia sp. TaxID=1898956 RepID=UPI002BA57F5D|nr:AAA family ATPase [Ottowia sp.]HOB65168.1 zeta toxin family protein [Ottowia sp.]HPZ57467.1 zeta toxin family protein [Ottowia sp.]HQD47693.1 zeta toxin family protein [Ottowia sp.]
MASRPVIYVLAGVNGAGKSSIGGHLLTRAGLAWFNPDQFARELVAATGCDPITANATAWTEGMRRLDDAVTAGRSFAFETTLGGRSVAARLKAAAATHDVLVWFCGLASPELHIARVQARVAAGGHAIPEAKIRERWTASIMNLIALLPDLAEVRVFDNSASVAPGEPVPDPVPVAVFQCGRLVSPAPDDAAQLSCTPDWAKPVLAAAW